MTTSNAEVEIEQIPPNGTVIAIMGIPRGDLDNIDDNETLRIFRNEAERVMDNVNVIQLPNVPLVSQGVIDDIVSDMKNDHPEPEALDLIKGIAMSGAFMETAMASMERYEEAAEAKRVAALTPEQKAQEEAKSRAYAQRIYKQAHEMSEKERAQALDTFFSTAQKWANLPELTATERCHGVAHDLYLIYGPRSGSDLNGRTVEYNRSDDYAQRYDHCYSDFVHLRQIRAAKELFGG